MMLAMLNPEYRFSSLEKITPEWLGRRHYRVLLLDIDNTLLPRSSSVVPDGHLHWLQQLQEQGIAVVLASNNGGQRIAAIKKQLSAKGLRIPLLTWAGKPLPRAYDGAFRLLEKSVPEVAVAATKESDHIQDFEIAKRSGCILAAGDQLFTDVLGAHWYNLPVAWLRPLSENDFIGTKILRVLEKGVTWYLARQNLLPEEDKQL